MQWVGRFEPGTESGRFLLPREVLHSGFAGVDSDDSFAGLPCARIVVVLAKPIVGPALASFSFVDAAALAVGA